MKRTNRSRLACVLLPTLFGSAGCPTSNDHNPSDAGPSSDASAPASTHEGTISIQDRTIHGVPQAGHGLSVLMDFSSAWRRPDFEDMPGTPFGCKAWLFDTASDPPPTVAGDVGLVTIEGTSAPIPHGCSFDPQAGYVCAATSGAGLASVRHSGPDIPGGAARFEIAGASFGPDERGRYLHITSDATTSTGLYPIIRFLSPTTLLVQKLSAPDADNFSVGYRTRAGVGPTAGLPHEAAGDPLLNGDHVTVAIRPGGGAWFRFPTTAPIPAGGSFTLDTASAGIVGKIPVDGSAFSIGCGGAGGACAPAQLSILRILTTDGATANISPFAMPPAEKKQLEISCVEFGGDGIVEVSADVSAYLASAHQAKAVTRVRTAFMRNGFSLAVTPPPAPPNPVRIVAGHQTIAFGAP